MRNLNAFEHLTAKMSDLDDFLAGVTSPMYAPIIVKAGGGGGGVDCWIIDPVGSRVIRCRMIFSALIEKYS